MLRSHFLCLVSFLVAGSAVGGEPLDPGALCPSAPLTLEQLVRMSHCDLEQLYLQAEPGPIPEGFARGKSIRWAGRCLAVPASRFTGLLWKGKWFDGCDATLVNEWCFGLKRIQARVCYG